MDTSAIGLLVSAIVVLSLSTLFRYETTRGVRFGEGVRVHVDSFVLKAGQVVERWVRFLGRDFIRQIFHYLFHTILRYILLGIRACERILYDAIRVNKNLAKNVGRETTVPNKLDAIAQHKVDSALSDEEKRAHRERTLNGL